MVQENLQEKRPSKNEKFVNNVLDIISPNKREHSEGIYGLFEIQARPDTFQWRQGRIAHSHLDWKTSRVGVINDQIAGLFGLYDITMRIGTARVRTAGINAEAMNPDYRDSWPAMRKKLAKASIEAMRTQGYDLSISFDDEEFWYNLGYVFAWKELDWQVNTNELPSEPPDFELHEFEPVHREDLAELYNRENDSLTGTAVRPTYLRNKHPGAFQGWFWTDAQGNPIGYISGGSDVKFSLDLKFQNDLDQGRITKAIRQRFEEGTQWIKMPLSQRAVCAVQSEGSRWLIVDGQSKYLIRKETDKLNVYTRERTPFWVDEVAGDPEQILRVLGTLARQSQCESVLFDRLHYKSALGRRLRQTISCQIAHDSVGGTRGSRSYVIRIINLQSLFEKLAPELSRQLNKSPLASWSRNLLISNGEEEVMLAIEHSRIRVVPAGESEHSIRGGQEITQLIVGTETPDEVVEMNNIQLSGDAEQLVEVLFPAQHPQMENQAL